MKLKYLNKRTFMGMSILLLSERAQVARPA